MPVESPEGGHINVNCADNQTWCSPASNQAVCPAAQGSDRGDLFIAEIDDFDLDGELPFLPRLSAGGSAEFADDASSGSPHLLPTHYAPPLKRTSLSAATATGGKHELWRT